MTTTDRGARLRAVQAAGAAAALLAVPGSAGASSDPPGNVAEGERDVGASRLAGETAFPALRAPIAGHLTMAGQMRAAGRAYEQRRLRRVAHELRHRARAEDRRPSRARLQRISRADAVFHVVAPTAVAETWL
jgi:hypothetical protein